MKNLKHSLESFKMGGYFSSNLQPSRYYECFDELDFKTAFTLAEVLITLGIIGVVAAMTMPVVVNNVQDKVLESQRKKTANILTNGYRRLLALEDVSSIQHTSLFDESCRRDVALCFSPGHKKIFNIMRDSSSAEDLQKFAKDFPSGYSKSEMKWDQMSYVFQTSDGYMYGLKFDGYDSTKSFGIYTDINSTKKPNTYGRDLITYSVQDNGQVSDTTNYGGEDPNKACSVDDVKGCSTEAACFALGDSMLQNGTCYQLPTIWVHGECYYHSSYCD